MSAETIAIDHARNLINLFGRHGVAIETTDIPEILELGADAYLMRRGIDLSERVMDEIYLVVFELRNETQHVII
jgi:hypothetical protein